MLSLGLSLQPADFTRALRQPRALLAGALAQVVLLPVVALSLLWLSGLEGDLAVGVMILSCCPGGITSNFPTLAPTLLSLNLLMVAVGLGLGALLRLPRAQATTLSIEAGFQNGTIGIVVGSLIGPAVMNGDLNSFSLPSAVYGVLMTVTIIPFVLWRRGLCPAS